MSNIRRKHKKPKTGLKILLVLISVFLIFILSAFTVSSALILTATNVVMTFFSDLPSLADFTPTENALTSRIYAADGSLIGTFHGEQNREITTLSQMPDNLINAVLAIEDERFYEHEGVDPMAIFRSLVVNIQAGEIAQGGSTITQQYVRNVYIPEEKTEETLDRKIKEAALAYQLEKIYTKDEILEMYLNTIYFGEGAYGVGSAAKVYFNRKVEDLDLAQCATIAAILQTPSSLSPYVNKEGARERRDLVLYKMLELGFIDREEFDWAIKRPIVTVRSKEVNIDFAPYFLEYVKQELIAKYGVNRVFEGGFEIYTSLDPKMQVAAEKAINEVLFDPEDPTAALVAIEPSSGKIKAMVGGKDFNEMKFNLASQGKRQPGSVFKVYALVAALEQGISPYTTYDPNGPVTYDIFGSEPWDVANYMGTNFEVDEMTVIEGTARSVNVLYAQLIMAVGAENIVKTAKDMGIVTHLEPYPAIGLGGLRIGVSPLEICASFATIANYGVKNDPVAILKVIDKDSNILEEFSPSGSQAISPINAYRTIEILTQAVRAGTGTRARLDDRVVAGKTGTTQEGENAWFSGFTTNLVASVWMGYPEENRKMGTIHDMRVAGGAHPAMIWKLFMEEATKDLPIEEFVRPEQDIINVQIVRDAETGQVFLPNALTPIEEITIAQYKYGQDPRETLPISMEDMPLMPNVSMMPWAEANHILVYLGFTKIEYINEVNPEVPSGYIHRQEPLGDEPVNPSRTVRMWVNP